MLFVLLDFTRASARKQPHYSRKLLYMPEYFWYLMICVSNIDNLHLFMKIVVIVTEILRSA